MTLLAALVFWTASSFASSEFYHLDAAALSELRLNLGDCRGYIKLTRKHSDPARIDVEVASTYCPKLRVRGKTIGVPERVGLHPAQFSILSPDLQATAAIELKSDDGRTVIRIPGNIMNGARSVRIPTTTTAQADHEDYLPALERRPSHARISGEPESVDLSSYAVKEMTRSAK
jgi:hypothetical protein